MSAMTQREMLFQQKGNSALEYFAKRCAEHGKPFAQAGAFHVEQLRAHLIGAKLDCTVIGRAPDGKCETYEQAFLRLFGEPLYASTRKRRAASHA
jgi:hypothetical protein